MQTILHLTDIHFGWEGKHPYGLAQRKLCLVGLLAELKKLQPPWKPTVICLTGDVGWLGAASDYAQAKKWFDELLDVCGLSYQELVVCPGNHDIIRDFAKKVARPEGAVEADQVLEPPIAIHLERLFNGFVEFCKTTGIPELTFGAETSRLVGHRKLNGVRFVALNSAWFCKNDEDEGKLWIGQPHMRFMEAYGQLPVIRGDSTDELTVSLLHHPQECLHAEEFHAYGLRANSIDYLAKRCHLLLTGHTHGIPRKPDRIADAALHFTGGSAFAGASHFNSFRLIQISDHDVTDRAFEFDPRATADNWKPCEANSRSLRQQKTTVPIVAASPTAFPIGEFRGACAHHSAKYVELKSRLLRQTGDLPVLVTRPVSLRVSVQRDQYDSEGRLIRAKATEQTMPFYEAARAARQTLLFGDLGTGKSTLVGQLATETLARSATTVSILIPVKSLKLTGHFSQRDLLESIDQYVAGALWLKEPKFEINRLLDQRVEVLLLFDGLDELPRELAARLLVNAATLVETWPTIQVVAAARPVEMAGVSFADWRVAHTVALDDAAKRDLLQAELIVDDFPQERAEARSSELISSLKSLPALDSVASSPLAIRLIYPRLKSASFDASLTLGDLLYELLLERLEGWHKRDDKPSTFTHLSEVLPSIEAKAEYLSVLAQRAAVGTHTTKDEAKVLFRELANHISGANEHRLGDEALSFFEWLGLISVGDTVEFPLQPLAEICAAVGLVERWRSKPDTAAASDRALWRVVSFAAALARRKGILEHVRKPLSNYLAMLIQREGHVPAACYIVVEAQDSQLAEYAVDLMDRVGFRPLTGFQDERQPSERNIAKALVLAGTKGFEWFYKDYLDPRYPVPNAGSAIVLRVFAEWAALMRPNLNQSQKERLRKLVAPYTATAEGNFHGVLTILAVLVPEAFSRDERLWNQSRALSNKLFAPWVVEQFRVVRMDDTSKQFVEGIVLHAANENLHAARLWLEWNPIGHLPSSILRFAFRVSAKSDWSFEEGELVSQCRTRIGQQIWMQFARWTVATEGAAVGAGAAKILFDAGERRLSILGNVVMNATHDGAHVGEAERILSSLVQHSGPSGVHWLAGRIANSQEWYGAHSGWWRVLLARLGEVEDAPALLAMCARNLGQYTIPRYPEIREGFARILAGEEGRPFREELRNRLKSLDPKSRLGAAAILVTSDPRGEAEALFVAIRSRAKHNRFDWHEWESFCLTLDFGPSVLSYLNGRLEILEEHSRALALLILKRAGIEIDPRYGAELTATLSSLDGWYLAREPAGRIVLQAEMSYERLKEHLKQPAFDLAERAAERLLELHGARLSPGEEAMCIALRDSKRYWRWELSNSMRRIANDPMFAEEIVKASNEIVTAGGSTPTLGMFAQAITGKIGWKDFIWEMLCNDSRPGGSSESDGPGMALLEYSFEVKDHRALIGRAAKECLEDPRMKRNRWHDAYHWLGLIADEFDGLDKDAIRKIILHGKPIQYAATTALIGRLEEVPKNFKSHRTHNERPADFTLPTKPDEASIKARLIEYARESHEIHPDIVGVIQECVFLPPIDDPLLTSISKNGRPGILIGMALRFIYGKEPNMRETIPLLDIWSKLWSNDDRSSSFKLLCGIWKMMRESSIVEDSQAGRIYLAALHQALSNGDVWKLAVAWDILELRRSLTDDEVPIIFSEIARHSSFLHEQLVAQLCEWLSRDLTKEMTMVIVAAAEGAIVSLNESSWISDRNDGDPPNVWANLFFPAVLWAHGPKSSDAAEIVFLRGVRSLFAQLPNGEAIPRTTLVNAFGRLDLLLARVPPEVLARVIRRGTESLEPSVAAFCRLIRAYGQRVDIPPMPKTQTGIAVSEESNLIASTTPAAKVEAGWLQRIRSLLRLGR